jgi:outer membrane receptor protein involved in Fe transport
VRDAATAGPLPGVMVRVKGTGKGAVTDERGEYEIKGLSGAKCTLVVSCVSYRTVEVTRDLTGGVIRQDFALESDVTELGEVVVTGRRRRDTEGGMVNAIKVMAQVANGVSAAQIAKTPDRVASEVARRVPGITLIDDRFIIVRGLSPRYNATWIDGVALPGMESDSRAFPFDLVPASQLDNLIVYKSPAPEIPADFSGGFVRITSKGIPDDNRVEVNYATGFNFNTQFHPFRSNPGGATDFLGFDLNKRPLARSFPAHAGNLVDTADVTRLARRGFNNDWRVRQSAPLPDQRLSLVIARRRAGEEGKLAGNITAITYSNTFKRVAGMKNARYGIYSGTADKPVYLDDYEDNQFSHDARVGLMHNRAFYLSPAHRFEWKNLLNILGSNRLTERAGIKDMSSMYYREQAETRYSSRLVYSGQLAGRHELSTGSLLTWDAGYSYAGLSEPDRRIVTYHAGIGSPADIPAATPLNESITRYFQRLCDHGVSLSLDYRRAFAGGDLKGGLRGEFRSREYQPREFIYRYDRLSHEERQRYLRLPVQEMLEDRYLGADKVYVEEITRKTSAYAATTWLGAGYLAVEIPWDKFSLHAGLRVENYHTTLSRDRSDAPGLVLESSKAENYLDLFPSVNALYRFSARHQTRLAYGRSVNRPELREISPSVYFDFDLFSEIGGNENLRPASIHNVDLRHEIYLAPDESLSAGLFYKHFRRPIEWTFVDMGGSLRYNHENAARAASWGVEVEARKKLWRDLACLLNVAWIRGNVHFRPGEIVSEPDRAMQGQSPYVINAALFYRNERAGLQLSLLYNRVGKRIVGLGKSNSVNQDVNSMIPDSYEMPRDLLDLALRQRVGRGIEIQCTLKDMLSRDLLYKQFPRFERAGVIHEREQITRKYNPGCAITLGVSFKLE